jgi:hypothetical protein
MGDFNDANVIVQPGGTVAGVIDFGDAVTAKEQPPFNSYSFDSGGSPLQPAAPMLYI